MEGTIKELNERLGEKLIRISPKDKIFIQALKPISSKFIENPDSIVFETKDVNQAWNLVAELSLKNHIPIREFRSTDLEIEQLFMKALDTEKMENQEVDKR